MFRLHVRLIELMHPDETELRQAARDVFAPGLAGFILVEHDDDVALAAGVLPDQFLLRGGQRAAHEGHHFAATVLVQLHGIEESFNDDERLGRRFFDGTINVEQLLRFAETLGQLVFGRVFAGFAGETARVGDDLALGVVDGNGDPLRHHALGAVSHAEINDGFEREAAFGKVGMTAFQFIQPELQRLVGRAVFLRLRRLCGRFRSGCVVNIRRFTRLSGLLAGLPRHGLGVEMEPFNGFERRRMNAHVIHPGDEVEGVAAVLALAETIPNVFADAHPKLRRVAAFVNRTRAAQAVAAPFELVQDAVVLKHLLHGDGRFDGLEVNER